MSDVVSADDRSGQRLIAFYEAKPIKSSSVGVDQLSVSRASEFDLRGPAVCGVVYVTHPSKVDRLIPFADYEEELARDKLNEALRVFMALGASRIVATVNRDTRTEAEARVGLRAVGLTIKGRTGTLSEVAFDHRGTGGAPVDPRPLRYPDEPGFDAACEGVLRLGGVRYKIEVVRTSQYGLDGDLALRLSKVGFGLGAGGARSISNRFVIEAVFGKDATGELDEVVESVSRSEGEAVHRPRSWFKAAQAGAAESR